MKRFKTGILLIATLFSFLQSYAQQSTVLRGRVLDKITKESVIGANIIEYDNQNRTINGTATNIDGDFVLRLKNPSNRVGVRVIGYKSKDIKVDPSKNLIIELESDDISIGEITIKAESGASGSSLTNISDRDNASSTVKLDMMEMKDAGITSASDALQGKVTGLDIISSGDAGSGSQIVIRGLSSIGNSKPLVVIDGIPQFTISNADNLSSMDEEDISNLVNVAVQDIKSITVLKDAGSTAIYGSKGADGVLLIETKKGRMGKVEFEYKYQGSLSIQPPSVPMLDGNEYIMLQLEEWHNSLGVFNIPPEIAYDKDYKDFYNYSANTDWISHLTKNGKTHDNYFSIAGGGEKTRFFNSYSYVDEGFTTVNNRARRFSTRIKLDYNLSENILFQINFNYNNNNIDYNLEVSGKNVRAMAYIKAPNMSIWEYDQYGKPTGEYFNPINSYQGNGITYFNPVAVANLGFKNKIENMLQNSFMLQFKANNWLLFRETVSFQYQGTKEKSFLPYTAIGADWINNNINQAKEGNGLGSSIRTETQAVISSPFSTKDHSLTGVLTWETEQESSEFFNTETNRSPSIDIIDPAVNAQINWMSNSSGEKRRVKGSANINYKYKELYMVQTTLTTDASSVFGENNRWGVFKSVSLAWRFSEEPIMKQLKFLNECKLRYSWGVAGRPPSDSYARFARYVSYRTYNGYSSILPSTMQLSNLRWQNVTSSNIGVELNLFKERFNLDVDLYSKLTTHILFEDYDIPQISGFEKIKYFNGGEMTNKGWEISTEVKVIKQKDWNLAFNFNVSRNNNSFSKLPQNFNPEKSSDIGNGKFPQLIREGEPLGSFYGFRYLGVFASDEDAVARDADGKIMYHSNGSPIPFRFLDVYTFRGGDPIYKDLNYDGKIDINDVEKIGDSNPDFMGSFGTSFKYKSLSLSASLYYRIGFDIINNIAIQTEGMNNRDNQSKAVLNRWRVQGQVEDGMLPRAYLNHPANNLGSDRYVEKGDYIRFNTLKLTYQFPPNLCSRVGLSKANITLSGRKLATFTKYSGQDPEVSGDAKDPFWIGVDKARTPPSSVYTVSFGVTF